MSNEKLPRGTRVRITGGNVFVGRVGVIIRSLPDSGLYDYAVSFDEKDPGGWGFASNHFKIIDTPDTKETGTSMTSLAIGDIVTINRESSNFDGMEGTITRVSGDSFYQIRFKNYKPERAFTFRGGDLAPQTSKPTPKTEERPQDAAPTIKVGSRVRIIAGPVRDLRGKEATVLPKKGYGFDLLLKVDGDDTEYLFNKAEVELIPDTRATPTPEADKIAELEKEIEFRDVERQVAATDIANFTKVVKELRSSLEAATARYRLIYTDGFDATQVKYFTDSGSATQFIHKNVRSRSAYSLEERSNTVWTTVKA